MKVVILGCATSTGVPIIGCQCHVCTSDNPKNKRTRCSVFIESRGKNILIDSSTDLRFQALKHNITRLDAVLYTHSHADHTHGIDELRTFNFVNDMVIPCYGNSFTINNLKNNFGYIFDGVYSAGGKPKLELNIVEDDFDFDGMSIIPVEINHASWMILGYRIGNFAYLTDCSGIPSESMEKLHGLDLLIISALRYREHPAHFNIEQAIQMTQKINPKLAVFTHMGHQVEYDTLLSELPDNIVPAYDGMEVELD
ncbi:MAG: MBL fold metallo-hydrolase [Thermodesulfobacteriota bacterium]|nr:MAG: MBL fold metallo-hydrolase [Thermodesulfobacteriota bacterium]